MSDRQSDAAFMHLRQSEQAMWRHRGVTCVLCAIHGVHARQKEGSKIGLYGPVQVNLNLCRVKERTGLKAQKWRLSGSLAPPGPPANAPLLPIISHRVTARRRPDETGRLDKTGGPMRRAVVTRADSSRRRQESVSRRRRPYDLTRRLACSLGSRDDASAAKVRDGHGADETR
ncbi:uncharacterized protein LOC144050745 isoform X2 [Vanacampus margaritifer]